MRIMLAPASWSLPLSPSNPAWIEAALADLASVYRDHLHCERKAAQSALSLMRAYPDRAELVAAMAQLAHEETRHVVQVSRLMQKQGVAPVNDIGDAYAAALNARVRRPEPARLLDRLLVFAVIEARSAQRLHLLGSAITDAATAALYRGFAEAEVRHAQLFLTLAETYAPSEWKSRAVEFCAHESAIMATLPVAARIH